MNQALTYSEVESQHVIPQPYSMGIGGETAKYESVGGRRKRQMKKTRRRITKGGSKSSKKQKTRTRK